MEEGKERGKKEKKLKNWREMKGEEWEGKEFFLKKKKEEKHFNDKSRQEPLLPTLQKWS